VTRNLLDVPMDQLDTVEITPETVNIVISQDADKAGGLDALAFLTALVGRRIGIVPVRQVRSVVPAVSLFSIPPVGGRHVASLSMKTHSKQVARVFA